MVGSVPRLAEPEGILGAIREIRDKQLTIANLVQSELENVVVRRFPNHTFQEIQANEKNRSVLDAIREKLYMEFSHDLQVSLQVLQELQDCEASRATRA
jgi:hypothetical protein